MVAIISKIYFCYIVFLIGVCYQNYENLTSSTTISSYILSVQSSGEVAVVTVYSDTACTTYTKNLTYSIGDCLQTGDTSYMSLSISMVSNPVLLPGMYYVGYQSQADCESMIDRPASYVVKYPTDLCTPVSDGFYFDGFCQANGNLSYSVYRNPACSGTAFLTGITALPGPPNHGCVSRLSLGEDIESSDSSSECAGSLLLRYERSFSWHGFSDSAARGDANPESLHRHREQLQRISEARVLHRLQLHSCIQDCLHCLWQMHRFFRKPVQQRR